MQLSYVKTHIAAEFKITAESRPMFVVLTTAGYFIQPQACFRVFTLASPQQLVNEMRGQSVAVVPCEWWERLIAAAGPTTVAVGHVHVDLPLE